MISQFSAAEDVSHHSKLEDPSALSKPFEVAFIIPALNEEKLIGQCIHAIHRLKIPSCVQRVSVCVVDNLSSDATAAIAAELGATVLSCPPGNVSRARNLGASTVDAQVLAFIDADCQPEVDWLEKCSPLLLEKDVLAVGSEVIPPPQMQGWVIDAIRSLAKPGEAPQRQKVRWLPTAGLLVKQKMFQTIGGFDVSLATCEDCDLGYRMSEHGSLYFEPSALLIHFGESRTARELFWREAWRSSGNLRLAMRRPTDLRNWISLGVPLLFATAILAGLAMGVGALIYTPLIWVALLFLLVAGAMPFAWAAAKQRRIPSPGLWLKQGAYFAVYFAGRALGLVWRFRRLARS